MPPSAAFGHGVGYTLRMVPPTAGSAADEPLAGSPPSGEPARPRGVELTALALGALIAFYLVQSLLQLAGEAHATRAAVAPLLLCGARSFELLLIWQYWKGRDFARLFVLLWSLLAAAQSIALLADHNLDPAALMGRPLSFLQAILALFLLYWLNTPRLRAWFKKISATAADLIAPRLVGRLCTALDLPPSAANSHPAWRLTFEHGAELTLTCPWRIVLDDNLAFVSSPAAHAPAAGGDRAPAAGSDRAPAAGSGALPHETTFPTAVPSPSTDPDDARRLLQNLRVTAVHLAPHTSDLFLTFEMGIQLQTWSYAPAAGSAHAPAAGSEALPHTNPVSHAPLWSFSGPGLTVIARADGLSSQLAAAPAETPADY